MEMIIEKMKYFIVSISETLNVREIEITRGLEINPAQRLGRAYFSFFLYLPFFPLNQCDATLEEAIV